jgi:serine/threonine protein kinase
MLTAGQKIGAYEIVAKLGAGGMGDVYRARDTELARDVAIKVLTPLVAGDPGHIARFQREAQLLAAFNHPNIAAIRRSD